MTRTRSVCLSLELDFEGERVTGWLADEQGNDWAFSSWLDLLSVIERVLGGARSQPVTTSASAGGQVKGDRMNDHAARRSAVRVATRNSVTPTKGRSIEQ
jgi:hypothetical protein